MSPLMSSYHNALFPVYTDNHLF